MATQVSEHKCAVPKLITSKDQILQEYPDVFQGIGNFPGPSYHIQIDPSVTPKQTPCHPIPFHLKEVFKQEIDKMLQSVMLKPVHEATLWINIFVFVENRDKLGSLEVAHLFGPDQSEQGNYKRTIQIQNA